MAQEKNMFLDEELKLANQEVRLGGWVGREGGREREE